MKKILLSLFLVFSLITTIQAKENIMILELKYGKVEIELYDKIAPNHVKRFKTLAEQ